MLTRAVCGDLKGADGMGAVKLKEALKKLFGRVTCKVGVVVLVVVVVMMMIVVVLVML